MLTMKKGAAVGPDDREEPEDKVPRSGHRALLLPALDVAPCLYNRSVTQKAKTFWEVGALHHEVEQCILITILIRGFP